MRKLCLIYPLLFAAMGPAAHARHEAVHWSIGALIPFSYNTSWANNSSTDFRLGAGIAVRSDFSLVNLPVSLMASVSKSELITQRLDGEKNYAICREQSNWFGSLFSIPGPCTLYQVRTSFLYRWQAWQAGISIIYQHTSDFTFNGSRIYNTRFSSQGFGMMGGYSRNWGKLSLHLIANLDYAPISQSPMQGNVADSGIRSVQVGFSLYAMYGIL